MRRALFFIVAIVSAATSFASIPTRAREDASQLFAPLPETRVWASDVLAPFERPAESELTRALHQAYADSSTTSASGLRCFLSVDPLDGLQRFPQSWNRYAYARNNPLKYIDPTGKYVFAACSGNDEQCQSDRTAFEGARQQDLQSQDSAVRAAAAAYGDPGQENGVTVAFGGVAQGSDAETTPSLQGNADGTMGMTASVAFRSGLSGTALRAAVGHEGQHVLDAQGFVGSFASNPSMEAGLSWTVALNLTVRQTETNAYRITQSIYAAAHPAQTFSMGCQGCTLGPGQTPADVNLAITRILTNPNGPYAGKLDNRQFPEWTTPPQPKP